MKITNETIAKLTNKELQDLGGFNFGINFYRGTLKKRVKSPTLKVTVSTDTETHFENEFVRHEFIKLASTSKFEGKEEQDWAYRFFLKEENHYDSFVPVLQGLTFLK